MSVEATSGRGRHATRVACERKARHMPSWPRRLARIGADTEQPRLCGSTERPGVNPTCGSHCSACPACLTW
eukprot:CAMPEP_0181176336 /NCGR_PEP_ID=MMETSP1096-20121128/4573_1 /TAXON_ID=156174 ORGANISM="Chrysochromulina ericina, Strain CCMP281" /NCGR_SAMPLE_ID=MMETSP1096 /ASSEMBLY_ACC=CAM_ASM_000453 /LENGTH=70 /DNA_ID=CAMNT_0023264413 /DNA_START=487 /DNA_END=699 /DNA_ORIENTATION=-